jgi:hypothetical protein
MNLKLVSKNNIGAIILLILVVILSQSKTFNFLIETVLGRTLLVILILGLSYINKIFGIVAVLLIVIMFNNSDFLYLEGFDTNVSNNTPKQSVMDMSGSIVSTQNSIQNNKNTHDKQSNNKKDNKLNVSNIEEPKLNVVATSSTTSSTSEGFDIIGIENTMKRGKQSNSIPVNTFMRDSKFVSAYEGSPFKENFSVF